MPSIKRDRFVSVASRRVNNVINSMQSLQKCSNTYNYEYSEDDVRKMLGVIRKQFDALKMDFDKGLSKKNRKFKF